MKDEPFELIKHVVKLSSNIKSESDFQYLAFVLKQVGVPFCQNFAVAKNGLYSPELDFMMEHLVDNGEIVNVDQTLCVAEPIELDNRLVPYMELIGKIGRMPIQLLKVLSNMYYNGLHTKADKLVNQVTGINIDTKDRANSC